LFEYYTAQELPSGATNRLKGLLLGSKAQKLTNGLVLFTEPVILRIDTGGKTNLVASSPECLVDPNPQNRIAFSTNRLTVRAPNEQMLLEGDGFLCRLTNFNLTLSNRAHTRIRQDVARSAQSARPGGAKALDSTAATTTNTAAGANAFIDISSQWANFDYQSNRAVYLRDVRVENPPQRVGSEKLTIQRATNGSVESILAEQQVVIVNTQDLSRASGDWAFHHVSETGQVLLLTGRPALWQDGLRTARGRRLAYDFVSQTLRAEQEASLRLPRTNLDQGGWMLGQANRQKNGAATNQFVDINAGLLDLQMPTTNRLGRALVAQTNVVIVSLADQSRATADRAVYQETNHTLELSGRAVWQRGGQVFKGDKIFIDNDNKVFRVERRAFVRIPVADLPQGPEGTWRRPEDGRRGATNAGPAQFIEVTSDWYEYRDDWLTFYDHVNGRFLEGDTNRATLTCGWVSFKFNSNRVERIVARQDLTANQLPVATANGTLLAKRFKCEYLVLTMNTNGNLIRAVALTNVVALKTEWMPGTTQRKFSWLNADQVTADFFAQSNAVERLVAERNVLLLQDQRSASGARAVYTATNNQVELTGNPKAETPQMKITDAQVIIWERTPNRFLVDRPKAEGQGPLKATNQTQLPPPANPPAQPPQKSKKKPSPARPWR
jgi:lipopolysaccharide export system protein LptA